MKNKVKKSPLRFPIRDAVDADKVMLVPVSKDFYVKAYREINRKRKRLQRSGACSCPQKKLWKCDGNCDLCRYRVPEPLLLHLHAPSGVDENIALIDIVADGGPLPEDIVADAELLSALLRELEQLSARERRMLELASTVSEREAAKQMGIPRNTFAYQWAQLRERLAQKLKDYR